MPSAIPPKPLQGTYGIEGGGGGGPPIGNSSTGIAIKTETSPMFQETVIGEYGLDNHDTLSRSEAVRVTNT